MSAHKSSFHRVTDLSKSDVQSLFQTAKQIKQTQEFPQLSAGVVGLVFLENSTRTRLSFEVAAKKMGLQTMLLQNDNTSSLSKGESLIDTIETVLAMKPGALVVRHSDAELAGYLKEMVSVPVINAGEGAVAHPTQALLDAFTLQEKFEDLSGKKLVIVGDVLHSRVASSNKKLLEFLGMEVSVCCPKEMFPANSDLWKGAKHFVDMAEAIKDSDVVMVLRVQSERHNGFSFNESDYVRDYRFEKKHLSLMSEGQVLLHPGPYVPGKDMQSEVLGDKRSLVRTQVENGVYVRAALLAKILGESCRI